MSRIEGIAKMNFIKCFVFSVLWLLVAGFVSAEEFHIPILVGQTGAAMSFGRNETDAYILASEDWNAKAGPGMSKVVLDFEDTQTSMKQIIGAFQRFSGRGHPVILGPTWLDSYPAVISMARKKNVLLVTPSAAIEAFSEEDRSWPVTFYHNSTIEIDALLKGISQRGLARVALIYEQEPFAEMIRKLMLAKDFKLVADIGVQAGEANFSSTLVKLKDKKLDALVVFVWDERSLLSLLQQIRRTLPEIEIATVHDGAAWLENPIFKPVLPRLIHTKFIISSSSFEKRFKQRFGYQPILTASNAYDALMSVLGALSAGHNTGSEIRNYLLSHELDTVTFGKFQFAADGSVPSIVEVVQFPANLSK